MHSSSITVNTNISPRDGMFAGNYDHYFSVGRSALLSIQCALQLAEAPPPMRVLDLPCGHGRVLRALKAEFADAEISACDIDLDGIQFCRQELGAVAIPSHEDCSRIPLDGEYNLIWCGSLITHLDAIRTRDFLRLFAAHLAVGGVLVFTTHGRRSVELFRAGTAKYLLESEDAVFEDIIRQYEETGFGYHDYSHIPKYGVSLTKLVWICQALESLSPRLSLLVANEAGWDHHQDVIACARKC